MRTTAKRNNKVSYKCDWASVADVLGKVPDKVIANKLGCTIGNVYRYRKARRVKSTPRSLSWDRISLGKYSDAHIATVLGVSVTAVRKQRRSRNIPAHRDAISKQEGC